MLTREGQPSSVWVKNQFVSTFPKFLTERKEHIELLQGIWHKKTCACWSVGYDTSVQNQQPHAPEFQKMAQPLCACVSVWNLSLGLWVASLEPLIHRRLGWVCHKGNPPQKKRCLLGYPENQPHKARPPKQNQRAK